MFDQNNDILLTQASISDEIIKYSFKCVRHHLFNDKIYLVKILPTMITLQEYIEDSKPKYKIDLDIENKILWKYNEHKKCNGFGIEYKNKVKYFYAEFEQLQKFRHEINCQIGFYDFYDHYRICKSIANAFFMWMHRIIRTSDNKYFLVNVLSGQKSSFELSLIKKEIRILKYIDNDSILKIHEIYKIGKNQYMIIQEDFKGINLYTYMEKCNFSNKHLTESDIKQIIQALLIQLSKIHQKQVIHRFLHPQNILICQENYSSVQIINFAHCLLNKVSYNKTGAKGYQAPEILNSNDDEILPWTPLCDVFSLGVIFYKLLSKGIHCFTRPNTSVRNNNKQCEIDWSQLDKYNYSDNCISLLKAMLQKDPKDRITVNQALQHQFFLDNSSNKDKDNDNVANLENAQILKEIDKH